MQQSTVTGLIGVGLMGHGIARNILKSGRQLTFLQHAGNQPTDDLLQAGAIPGQDIPELVAQSDVIILCVTGAPEVEQVMFAEQGVLSVLKPGQVVIDCSTSLPATSVKIDEAVRAAGAAFMDAPMTRTPREAEEGRLNLIVGGDETLFQSQLPLLQSFAENVTHAGPVGTGHSMKLLHNFVSLGFSALLAEASACARRFDIDRDVFLEVLAKGGGAGVILDRMSPFIRESDDSAFRFSMANALKDMGYYLDMASHQGAQAEVAAAIRSLYAEAEQRQPGLSVPHLVDLLSD